tara:strand:- start:13021 stop:13290 length:270 start_codon:yes stop_codon:yes gene_type:complete
MKKYARVVKEQRTPLTAEELTTMDAHLASGRGDADGYIALELMAEVKHLRRMMAIAYGWIGRKAPSGTTMNRDYMAALKEAARIKKEDE